MPYKLHITLLLLLSATTLFAAQEQVEYLDGDELLEGDYSLFRLESPPLNDDFGESIKYLRDQVESHRRGLDYWQLSALLAPARVDAIVAPLPLTKFSISSSSQRYRVGASGAFSRSNSKGWSYGADIDIRYGRDGYFDGLYQQSLYPTFTLSHLSAGGGSFAAEFKMPISQNSDRYATASECYEISGNNSYNPSWGLYHGKVRSSNVYERFMPELSMLYEWGLTPTTQLRLSADGTYGIRSRSRLGWYDAYNPLPDYYRRLPSYMAAGEGRDMVSELWREGDINYTQIDWDRLESFNLLSTSGEALYVVEKSVEQRREVEFKALFESAPSSTLTIHYGIECGVRSSRNYKQMDDLLGGEYLLDIDQYVGDNVQVGNDMQNNLLSPNRKIYEGDRFGYDYTLRQRSWSGLFGFERRGTRLDILLDGAIGEYSINRVGHYQKERFATTSYGSSEEISLPSYSLRCYVGYALAARHYLTLRGDLLTVEPYLEELFVQGENSNRVVDNPTLNKISSFSLGYRYSSERVKLQAEGYILSSRDGLATWQSYDDLSGCYCDNVISNISTLSMGVELRAEWEVAKDLRWSSNLAAGGYQYVDAPVVTLYNDVDLSLVSQSKASAIEGCVVGNAPQLSLSSSLSYLWRWRYIFTMEGALAAMRYIEPSILLRTDRMVAAVRDDESIDITEQESLGNLFNLNITIVRLFYLPHDRRMVATLKVQNILSNGDDIYYGREGNRLLSHSSSGTNYCEDNRYEYCYPRGFYLSLSYKF